MGPTIPSEGADLRRGLGRWVPRGASLCGVGGRLGRVCGALGTWLGLQRNCGRLWSFSPSFEMEYLKKKKKKCATHYSEEMSPNAFDPSESP